MFKLPTDCLNEIFEYFENDEITLRSCLLVSRLWCEISVRILWRNIRNYNTLFACLLNESKEILGGVITLASKSPMFNYASFCKVLSIEEVSGGITRLLKNQQFITIEDNKHAVIDEILKFIINRASLNKLELSASLDIQNFILSPGAKNCLEKLSELCCDSDVDTEFFYQLSQTCHNLQSLNIKFAEIVSNKLVDLISVQKNLKYLNITRSYLYYCENLTTGITDFLAKVPNTLTKLYIYGEECHIPLSFITKFTNLQELRLSFGYQDNFEDFDLLQHVNFSQLQILKFQYQGPRKEILTKFLENNGKKLKEIYLFYSSCDSINLTIIKFCPNLRKLFTGFKNNELETLKMMFKSCKHLESVKVWCSGKDEDYLSEKDILKTVVKYSSKNFYELRLCYSFGSNLLPKELEWFFMSWTNRKPLSFILIHNDSNILSDNNDNMRIIEKYIKLGIIKKFQITDYSDEDFDE